MRRLTKARHLALAGGLALALPLAAAASEPMHLDAAQLDSIVAGIDVGLSLDASGGTANGFIFSNVFANAQTQTIATPSVGTGTGTAVITSLAIGSTNGVPPSATAPIPTLSNVTGTVLVDRSRSRTISRPGVFEAAYSYRAVAVVDDSFGLF